MNDEKSPLLIALAKEEEEGVSRRCLAVDVDYADDGDDGDRRRQGGARACSVGAGVGVAAVSVLTLLGITLVVVVANHTGWYTTRAGSTPTRREGNYPPTPISEAWSRDMVQISPKHRVAYCHVPKVASSTLTTYMTGLNHDLYTFSAVEDFIIAQNRTTHFADMRTATIPELVTNHSDAHYRFLMVVRHPGTRLYSSWFDKIHAHHGEDQPKLYEVACGNDPECTFETFVDGVTRYMATTDPRWVNAHVAPQMQLCNAKKWKFDMVYKLEEGFETLSARLERWTGVHFDFKSTSGDVGYSHHSERAEDVYAKFPVDDAERYEKMMPYDVQMKIYAAFKTDFDVFGYRAPVKMDTQFQSCPVLPVVKVVSTDTKWGEEDLEPLV